VERKPDGLECSRNNLECGPNTVQREGDGLKCAPDEVKREGDEVKRPPAEWSVRRTGRSVRVTSASVRRARRLIGLLALVCQIFPEPTVAWAQGPGSTVVLIGIDGFHPSYLERPQSRHLRELAETGVRARSLVPVFPTLTFPNFYTMATGLYPEHHGIVSNTMVDAALGRFTLRDRTAVRDPRWWGGEPIWATAVRQGKRAATFFWPGSDVAIGGVRPTWYKVFDASVPNAVRVTQVLDWLSLPVDRAPSLITVYFGDVDDAGHDFGHDSPQMNAAIARVDSAVGAIMDGVKQRGVEGRVNLVVVSDHGMARVEPGQLIYLDDAVDPGKVNIVDQGALLSVSPKQGSADTIFHALARMPHLEVYRKQEMARFHYGDHPRIPDVVAIADEGWLVTTRGPAAIRSRLTRGAHGYPPETPSMQAIFLARGPAFEKGLVVPPFQNVHIYALVAHLLAVAPAPNDGSVDSVRAVLAK
jgi:predicted AlkP superfamily pyrophosphatase or phosphodiesterase